MESYIAMIAPWAGTYAPRDWEFCHGQLLPIANYAALFSVIGLQFGGDGRTTFGLPDLRSRVPVGAGQGAGLSNYASGQMGGAERVALNASQVPAHHHTGQASLTIEATTDAGGKSDPGEDLIPARAVDSKGDDIFGYSDNATGDVKLRNGVVTGSFTTDDNAGGNQPHSNVQPYVGIHYIICTNGLFPPRH